MNKKIILWIFAIIGIFGLLWFSGRSNLAGGRIESENKRGSGGGLTAEEMFYDFGRISMKDGNVSKEFKIFNLTDKDINLEKLTTSCMCTAAYIINEDGSRRGPFGMPGHGIVPRANHLIKAGDTRKIEVVFNPNAHGPAGVGLIERVVYLEDGDQNRVELKFKAVVTP